MEEELKQFYLLKNKLAVERELEARRIKFLMWPGPCLVEGAEAPLTRTAIFMLPWLAPAVMFPEFVRKASVTGCGLV